MLIKSPFLSQNIAKVGQTVPLSIYTNGSTFTVKKVCGNPAVRQHLSELGFSVGCPVTVVTALNGNIIVKVKESRIAIDRMLANRIFV